METTDVATAEAAAAVTVEDAIREKVRSLPPDKRLEVLDFIEFLEHKAAAGRPLRSLRGLWADLGPGPTEEEIDEARKEMWGNFPREDI
jgi:hypothetical protein